MDCRNCKDRQYCLDCKREDPDDEEGTDSIQRVHKGVATITIDIQGDAIYYDGYPYHIVGIKQGDPNLRVYTEEIVFYLRKTNEEKHVLIKMERIPKKRK